MEDQHRKVEASMTIPAYLPPYVIGGSIAIIAAILVGLRRALAHANWPHGERAQALRVASVVLIGWFAGAVGLALLDVYHGASDRIPTIQFGILIPILIGAALISRSAIVARVIDAVPQSWIVGVQLYRALGAMFLVLYASGKLPGLFAWPAGVGDIAIGLVAPVVALLYARNPHDNSGTVAIWNVLGIADLVVAVGTGFLTTPSPFQVFALDAPNELITVFPLVLIPVFLVPVSILLHVASLTKLSRSLSASSHPAKLGMAGQL
jgi:hypothetical protein